MQKSLLVLPDGQRISSGVGTRIAIRKLKLTQTVNSGEELELGSACTAVLEAELFTPGGSLSLTAGDTVTVYQVDEMGNEIKKGVFILEKPTRPSANILRLCAYDRMSLLDRDMTAWLDSLTGWPYTLSEFARMVCTACGLELIQDQVLNQSFPVRKFHAPEFTGRRIMQWIGEIAGCFCYADTDGKIRLRWYEDTGLTVCPTGVYGRSLTYRFCQSSFWAAMVFAGVPRLY